LILLALLAGSSGRTRTSNPPVNSAKTTDLAQFAGDCEDVPDGELDPKKPSFE
jgi:hypothetical protein